MVLSYRVYVLVAPSIGSPSEFAKVFDSVVERFRCRPSFEGSEYFMTGTGLNHYNSGCIYFKYPVPFSTVNKLVPSLWHIVPLY